ncbi:conserved Plasmodium protein, unknown function [Plasmodium berghei]|uniref:WD repeat-containing protein n=1 Tax=Plasmodium berghei TaxID=5821 RepID=A0A113QIV2_PLABE|nr:conserved Plasmodium protein, unknown function [Plasmodium berghei]SCO58826.1 conserved Plasmodium protein, unknown function [Plasmodium berghei]
MDVQEIDEKLVTNGNYVRHAFSNRNIKIKVMDAVNKIEDYNIFQNEASQNCQLAKNKNNKFLSLNENLISKIRSESSDIIKKEGQILDVNSRNVCYALKSGKFRLINQNGINTTRIKLLYDSEVLYVSFNQENGNLLLILDTKGHLYIYNINEYIVELIFCLNFSSVQNEKKISDQLKDILLPNDTEDENKNIDNVNKKNELEKKNIPKIASWIPKNDKFFVTGHNSYLCVWNIKKLLNFINTNNINSEINVTHELISSCGFKISFGKIFYKYSYLFNDMFLDNTYNQEQTYNTFLNSYCFSLDGKYMHALINNYYSLIWKIQKEDQTTRLVLVGFRSLHEQLVNARKYLNLNEIKHVLKVEKSNIECQIEEINQHTDKEKEGVSENGINQNNNNNNNIEISSVHIINTFVQNKENEGKLSEYYLLVFHNGCCISLFSFKRFNDYSNVKHNNSTEERTDILNEYIEQNIFFDKSITNIENVELFLDPSEFFVFFNISYNVINKNQEYINKSLLFVIEIFNKKRLDFNIHPKFLLLQGQRILPLCSIRILTIKEFIKFAKVLNVSVSSNSINLFIFSITFNTAKKNINVKSFSVPIPLLMGDICDTQKDHEKKINLYCSKSEKFNEDIERNKFNHSDNCMDFPSFLDSKTNTPFDKIDSFHVKMDSKRCVSDINANELIRSGDTNTELSLVNKKNESINLDSSFFDTKKDEVDKCDEEKIERESINTEDNHIIHKDYDKLSNSKLNNNYNEVKYDDNFIDNIISKISLTDNKICENTLNKTGVYKKTERNDIVNTHEMLDNKKEENSKKNRLFISDPVEINKEEIQNDVYFKETKHIVDIIFSSSSNQKDKFDENDQILLSCTDENIEKENQDELANNSNKIVGNSNIDIIMSTHEDVLKRFMDFKDDQNREAYESEIEKNDEKKENIELISQVDNDQLKINEQTKYYKKEEESQEKILPQSQLKDKNKVKYDNEKSNANLESEVLKKEKNINSFFHKLGFFKNNVSNSASKKLKNENDHIQENEMLNEQISEEKIEEVNCDLENSINNKIKQEKIESEEVGGKENDNNFNNKCNNGDTQILDTNLIKVNEKEVENYINMKKDVKNNIQPCTDESGELNNYPIYVNEDVMKNICNKICKQMGTTIYNTVYNELNKICPLKNMNKTGENGSYFLDECRDKEYNEICAMSSRCNKKINEMKEEIINLKNQNKNMSLKLASINNSICKIYENIKHYGNFMKNPKQNIQEIKLEKIQTEINTLKKSVNNMVNKSSENLITFLDDFKTNIGKVLRANNDNLRKIIQQNLGDNEKNDRNISNINTFYNDLIYNKGMTEFLNQVHQNALKKIMPSVISSEIQVQFSKSIVPGMREAYNTGFQSITEPLNELLVENRKWLNNKVCVIEKGIYEKTQKNNEESLIAISHKIDALDKEFKMFTYSINEQLIYLNENIKVLNKIVMNLNSKKIDNQKMVTYNEEMEFEKKEYRENEDDVSNINNIKYTNKASNNISYNNKRASIVELKNNYDIEDVDDEKKDEKNPKIEKKMDTSDIIIKGKINQLLTEHEYNQAFTLALSIDIEKNTNAFWVLQLCHRFHEKMFLNESLTISQPALLSICKILCESLIKTINLSLEESEFRLKWIRSCMQQLALNHSDLMKTNAFIFMKNMHNNISAFSYYVENELAKIMGGNVNDNNDHDEENRLIMKRHLFKNKIVFNQKQTTNDKEKENEINSHNHYSLNNNHLNYGSEQNNYQYNKNMLIVLQEEIFHIRKLLKRIINSMNKSSA